MKKERQSFTLGEVLIVIVTIGILSSFLFLAVNNTIDRVTTAKTKVFSESIRDELLLSLVGEWKLDSNTDNLWGSLSAINYGAVFISDEMECVSSSCVSFNGVNEFIDLRYSLDGDKTISLWAKSFEEGQNLVILFGAQSPSSESRYYIGYDAYGYLGIGVGEDGWNNESAGFILDSGWHHYALVSNGDNHKVYVDGILLGEKDGVEMVSTENYFIGANHYFDMSNAHFYGLIDEVQIYDIPFSESQVKQNYLAGLNNLYAKSLP